MLPTLNGRIQSRIFFLATIGSFWTFVMSSILPASIAGADVPWKYRLQDGFVALMWVAILGVVWECIYHFLMQWRWEKDWPTFFGFATFLNEGLAVYLLGNNGVLPGFAGRQELSDANLTILNGTQGVSEVIAGLVGQGLSIFDTLTRSTPVNGHSRLTAPAPAPAHSTTSPAPQG